MDFDEITCELEDDLDTQNNGSKTKTDKAIQLAEGEEGYLLVNIKKIFKAKYSSCPIGTIINHLVVDDNCTKFIICKILLGASFWTAFDMDVHSPRAFT